MKPQLFVGSSSKDLLVASALSEYLRPFADVRTWTEDVFTLTDQGIKGIQRFLDAADLGLFIVGLDDSHRGASLNPNLIVELGLSVGHLGLNRTAILMDKRSRARLPSDLRTLHVIEFQRRTNPKDLRVSLKPAVLVIRRWIGDVGLRQVPFKQRAPFRDPYILEFLGLQKRSPGARKGKNQRAHDRHSVFISYAHADARWLARIQTMLSPVVRADRISVWDATRIKPGTKWRSEIQRAIKAARVALLLVSPSFLASPFIAEEELPPLLNAARSDGLVIVWALVSACLYKKTPLAEYQAAHQLSKPLDSLPAAKRNQALLSIAEAIGNALDTTKHGA